MPPNSIMIIDESHVTVGQLGAMGFYDLPLTYLEDFMAQIQALSAEQVKTAMAKHLSPEAMLRQLAFSKTGAERGIRPG